MLIDVSYCVCRFFVDVVKVGVELCRVMDKFVIKECIFEIVKFFMMEGVLIV